MQAENRSDKSKAPQRASEAEPASERTLVIARVLDAPARLLFEAHAKPEHLRKWFGPPGYPLTLCEMDFRVGGKYRFAMTGPDGQQMTPFGGTYLEIVRNERIQWDDAWEDADAERMVVTVTFDEQKDVTTKMTITTVFASITMMKKHLEMGYEQGVSAGFAQLASVVNDLAERSFAITRVIDAPARLLFETYSKPEHLKQWYGPPGYPLTRCDVDFRVGGAYRFQMTGPDGNAGPMFGGKYLEITPFERIVYDDAFEQPGAEHLVFVVDFIPDASGTRTTLTQTVLFDNVADKKKYIDMGMLEGCTAALDQLHDLATSLARTA